jgi:hypothetical protein
MHRDAAERDGSANEESTKMAQPAEIQHPTFGTLRLESDFYGEAIFLGEAWLNPKHRVIIEFRLDEETSLAEGLEAAQQSFDRFRRHEHKNRLKTAKLLLPEVQHFFSEDYTQEEVAKQLSLVRLDLVSGGGGTAHYDSGRKFKADTITAHFGEDGKVSEVDDLN